MPDPRDTSGGQFPTAEIGGKLYYLDYHNVPHSTQREAIEANAAIEEMKGRNPCQRGLDIPGFFGKGRDSGEGSPGGWPDWGP